MLYTDIRKLQKLDAKRSPMFDKNRFAKFLMYFAVAFWAAYLIFFGVMLSFAFEEDSPNMEPYHVLNQGLIIFLILDFLIRFLFPTPVQAIKPFLLLPVPKRKIMSILLIDSGLSLFNLFWLFFFVPFALITVTRFYGLTGVIGYALGIWLLMVFNSYWSMLIKVLIRQKFLNILWVVPVYGILALIEFLPETGWLSTFTMNLGEAFILWNPLSYLGELAAIFLMAYINYRVQLKLIHNELSRKEDTHVRHISSYSFFDRYGNVGEYMRLELKMLRYVRRLPYLQCLRRKQPDERFHVPVLLHRIRYHDTHPGHGHRRELHRRTDGTERKHLQHAAGQILPAMHLPPDSVPALSGSCHQRFHVFTDVTQLPVLYHGTGIRLSHADGGLQ